MYNLESLSQPAFVEKDAQLLSNELHESFGNKKKFLPGYELAALTALSFYPELANIKIEFVKSKSRSHPFSAHPKYRTVFRSPKNRTYVVCISSKMKKSREEIAPENLSFNMMVGCIAHELSHISDFLHKSSMQTIGTAWKCRRKNFRKKYERRMDLLTIAHGMGNQVKDFARRVQALGKFRPKDRYLKTYFDYYLRPEEIDRVILLREQVKPRNLFDDARQGRKP